MFLSNACSTYTCLSYGCSCERLFAAHMFECSMVIKTFVRICREISNECSCERMFSVRIYARCFKCMFDIRLFSRMSVRRINVRIQKGLLKHSFVFARKYRTLVSTNCCSPYKCTPYVRSYERLFAVRMFVFFIEEELCEYEKDRLGEDGLCDPKCNRA